MSPQTSLLERGARVGQSPRPGQLQEPQPAPQAAAEGARSPALGGGEQRSAASREEAPRDLPSGGRRSCRGEQNFALGGNLGLNRAPGASPGRERRCRGDAACEGFAGRRVPELQPLPRTRTPSQRPPHPSALQGPQHSPQHGEAPARRLFASA